MIMLFLLKYWRQTAAILLIVAGAFTITVAIYNAGYRSAKKEWDTAIAERNEIQVAQIAAITSLSQSVMQTADILTAQSDANLNKILMTVRDKPLYNLVDGKCAPSSGFERVFIDTLTEGNK